MKNYRIAGLCGLALLAACGGGNEAGAGGVTAEESKQLNEAAEMLDQSPDTVIPADETGLANEAAGVGAETGDVMVADDAGTNGQ